MRGTGSHAIRVDDAFVPERFAPSWADPHAVQRPWTAMPRSLGFGGIMASILLGMLRAATERNVSLELGARGYSQVFHIADTARRSISELYSVSTNAAYRTQNRIDRARRDARAACAGLESFRGVQFDTARVLTGNQPKTHAF